jgi:hypothetical protein
MDEVPMPLVKLDTLSAIDTFYRLVQPLTDKGTERYRKINYKVLYAAIFYKSSSIVEAQLQMKLLYDRVHTCLDTWKTERIDNPNYPSKDLADYFITNSEDETTVRVDIVPGKSYQVRLQVY